MAMSMLKYLRAHLLQQISLVNACAQKDVMRRRQLLILVLGFASLIAITFIGTSIESIVAFLHPTNSIQKAQAGPYQVTLQVTPNPPSITRPVHLTLQIVRSSTQQLLTNAHVSVESNMEAMDMGTDRVD